ncbi:MULTISPECIES: sodium:solute symporter family transporter [Flavobacteriaceae]|uniref:sodium:solute symporter family transporter n=1 Tax=Flavobacteriaceae TaxID=49546 RepID=UPI001493081D|nr:MULTISPECIES: sodium/solute symporter [Allomuricauda]MDC6366250.1 sodium/solute symporter [Muricauda sp. AC10]
MRTVDLIIFLAFIIGVTIFGGRFYKKKNTSQSYTLGSSIPDWVVTMSIFATFVSSISYLALPGSSYSSNWNAFVFSLSLPIASLVAVKFFVPLYRKINSPSAYTYLEVRYGPWASIYASLCYLFTQIMRIGTILYLLALTLNALTDWDIATIIIVTGALVAIYSALGGISAILWTDAIQGIILIAGSLICLLYLFIKMPEGPMQIFEIGFSQNKFSLGDFNFDFTESTFWVVLIYGVFINLQNYGIDQNYVQRYMVSKSEKSAKKSALIGGLMYIPISAIFLLIGTSLFAYYQTVSQLPPELMEPNSGDKIFPYFIANELPVGISGILMASIFAAGMSTISTSLNSSATVFYTNYIKKIISNKKVGYLLKGDGVKYLYILSIAISIIGIGVSILMINVKSALDVWWKLSSIFSGGMLGLFLLGVFLKSKNKLAPILGTVSGILVIFYLNFPGLGGTTNDNTSQFHPYLTIVFGTMTIFLIGFLISLLLPYKSKSK